MIFDIKYNLIFMKDFKKGLEIEEMLRWYGDCFDMLVRGIFLEVFDNF